tara:strand:+ start:585 stop:1004 length:420 start_codon:yes stop_codon:yes gene_type:complete
MATTTASITLTSDLLSDAMSVTADTVCMKAGSASDGLDMMDYGYIDIATGTEYDLLDSNNSGLNTAKANKVYIANHSTDETFYVVVAIDGVIGRLYAGDWMFIPWGCVDQHDDIEITANGGTNTICYALFHEGRTLTAS